MSSKVKQILNFNIDEYLNPVVPTNQLKHLPKPISRWLGYRSQEPDEPPALVQAFFSFTGALVGLLLVGAIYRYAPGINQYKPPILIASLGASAVLEYSSIKTPLAQPRNTILGHGICAVLGVAISKSFQGYSDWREVQWVAAAIACATASLATSLTNTVHPPGGATAVLACVEPTVIAMGWWFVPVLLVGICIMMGVSLLNNNIARQYPVYWWSPEETGQALKKSKQQDEEEQQPVKEEQSTAQEHDDAQSDTTLQQINSNTVSAHKSDALVITAAHLILPPDMMLTSQESEVLQALQARLQQHGH